MNKGYVFSECYFFVAFFALFTYFQGVNACICMVPPWAPCGFGKKNPQHGSAVSNSFLFNIEIPLDFSVRCTKDYWQFISRIKHPVLRYSLDTVKETLANPDSIRRSRKDLSVYLLYKAYERAMDVCGYQKTRRIWILNNGISNRFNKSWRRNMDKVKVIHDKVSQSLLVWLGDPDSEYVCEETTDEIILMKDKKGKVIGFEVLHYAEESSDSLSVETLIKQAG